MELTDISVLWNGFSFPPSTVLLRCGFASSMPPGSPRKPKAQQLQVPSWLATQALSLGSSASVWGLEDGGVMLSRLQKGEAIWNIYELKWLLNEPWDQCFSNISGCPDHLENLNLKKKKKLQVFPEMVLLGRLPDDVDTAQPGPL